MKYFILLLVLLSMCFADEHRLLVTGFTKHETSSRPDGEKFNEFNYGGGYEYTSFEDYDKFYFASNITVIRDSFDKPQYTFFSLIKHTIPAKCKHGDIFWGCRFCNVQR